MAVEGFFRMYICSFQSDESLSLLILSLLTLKSWFLAVLSSPASDPKSKPGKQEGNAGTVRVCVCVDAAVPQRCHSQAAKPEQKGIMNTHQPGS